MPSCRRYHGREGLSMSVKCVGLDYLCWGEPVASRQKEEISWLGAGSVVGTAVAVEAWPKVRDSDFHTCGRARFLVL